LNLAKKSPAEAVDAKLRRSLGSWAAVQHPPVLARATLVRAAKQELSARQHNPSGFGYYMGDGFGSVLNLNQTLGVYFTLQARVRF
jgi:hypothetical protein